MTSSDYIGLVTVRTSSTRLPEKCLLSFGEGNVISHVVKRAVSYGIRPIICTSIDPSDDILENIARELNVECFRGSMKNKLKRWFDCAEKFNIECFHTIDADDPFFDPVTIKKSLLKCAANNDIIFPSKVSRAGGASEGYSFSFKAIEKLNKIIIQINKNNSNIDTEMIERFIDHKIFKIKVLEGSNYEIKKARLTLDYEEDYEMLSRVRDLCGNFTPRKKINDFLKKNRNILNINFFRNDDWEKKQKILLKI